MKNLMLFQNTLRGEEQKREEGEMAQKKLGGGEIGGKSREEGKNVR